MERESGEGSEGEDGRGLPDPAVVKSYYFTVKKKASGFPRYTCNLQRIEANSKKK